MIAGEPLRTASNPRRKAPANASGGLSLTKELAYGELVGVPSTQEPGKMRVVAGDCANSYLFHKVTNTGIASNKKPMPPTFDGPNKWVGLCVEKQQAICAWINAGALEN